MKSSSFLYEVVRMIAELYGPSPVVAVLMGAEADVRKQCARVLKSLGPTATPVLIAALKDTDAFYQSIISEILIDIG